MTITVQKQRLLEYGGLGDFQTPKTLTDSIVNLVNNWKFKPHSVIEPTCGTGNFVFSALQYLPSASSIIALEIQPTHVERLKERAAEYKRSGIINVIHDDFFHANWDRVLERSKDPLLVIGNPPWVTNSKLSVLNSSNVPTKSNFQGRTGYDALTGKSNFDISEWMLLKIFDWLNGRNAVLAMLLKTSVARKVLTHAWAEGMNISKAEMRHVDSKAAFGATVSACVLLVQFGSRRKEYECHVYDSLDSKTSVSSLGFADGYLLSNLKLYQKWNNISGTERNRWRSGIKHDCAKVMELSLTDKGLTNGFDERVEIEDCCLFPMLKASDIGRLGTVEPKRFMVVTQAVVGGNTDQLQVNAPKTWTYLQSHSKELDNRASKIYKDKPRFAMFGIGNYSFTMWKVGIAGLSKKLDFKPLGPHRGKPIVLDDTCYFLPCNSQAEAEFMSYILNSEPAKEFLGASIFWDNKRPITAEVLHRLNLRALARTLDLEERFISLKLV